MGKRKTSGAQNPNKKTSGDRNPNKKTKSQEHLHHHAVTQPPYLPELIVHQIVLTLPTIPAVTLSLLSKHCESILSSLPVLVLDFEEGGDDQYESHRKFIKSLKGCLNYFSRKNKKPVDKLRLHMPYADPWDSPAVDKCLRFAIKRRVKEIDISLGSSDGDLGSIDINLWTLLKAKFITVLTLDYMRLNMELEGQTVPQIVFPSLKTLSLTRVHVKGSSLCTVIKNCPSIESLSLSSCCLVAIDNQPFVFISSSTLKYLEVKNCICWNYNNQNRRLWGILLVDARNLESLITFDSRYDDQHFGQLYLFQCWNLKYFRLNSKSLESFVLVGGCEGAVVRGTINAPNLLHLNFTRCLSTILLSEFCLEAPNLLEARIILKNLESTFSLSREYFCNLRDFLAKFGCSKKITLYVSDGKALIFPENFRRLASSSPILPSSVEEIKVFKKSTARDSELMDSLSWIAPSASIEISTRWSVVL